MRQPVKHVRFFVSAVSLGLAFLWVGAVVAFETQPSNSQQGSEIAPLQDFASHVAPLLDRRCAGCHAGEYAQADFRIDDRDSVLGYIEPGDPESSILWTDYLNAETARHDPATTVMPLSGPMAAEELSVVRRWIEAGAEWPEGIRFVSIGGIPDRELATPLPTSLFARLCGFFGYFHPATVHFPIALLMFGGAAAFLSFFTGGRAYYVAFYCLLWGTFFAIIASLMGWCFAHEKGYPAWSVVPTEESLEAASAVFRHRWLGIATTLVAVACVILAIISHRSPNPLYRHLWRWGLIVSALLVSIVGHQGGELVYGDIIARAFERLFGVGGS
jgi:uncharacterized membrane protein